MALSIITSWAPVEELGFFTAVAGGGKFVGAALANAVSGDPGKIHSTRRNFKYIQIVIVSLDSFLLFTFGECELHLYLLLPRCTSGWDVSWGLAERLLRV